MKKQKTIWSVYIAGCLLWLLWLPNAAQSQGLKGSCSGTATQHNPDMSYSVTMQLNGNSGTISYGSIGCGGTVTFMRKEGSTYWYKESITYGQKECVDGGVIQMLLLGNTASWQWTGNGPTVNATLTGDVKPAQDVFQITILRQQSTNQCTMGYMSVNGEIMGYTLELPWKNNQQNVSSIPAGTYNGILRYDKSDKWRIQLENVPNRTGVQIHIGNYTKEIKGCVLIGNTADVNNCSVYNSGAAYTRLKEMFYGTANPVSSPNLRIEITFQ